MTLSDSRAEVSPEIKSLLSTDRFTELTEPEPGILSTIGEAEAPHNRRFEAFYGRLYSLVIQTPTLRRAAFSLWGSADPLYELETFVGDAVRAARSLDPTPILVDLPSGAATLHPFLVRERFDEPSLRSISRSPCFAARSRSTGRARQTSRRSS